MMSILENAQVQAAIVALIVVALNALAQWVRGMVSHTKIVDEYWCYLQPVVEQVRLETAEAMKSGKTDTSVLQAIVRRGLVQWAESFRLNERKEPTDTQLAAMSEELEAAVNEALN